MASPGTRLAEEIKSLADADGWRTVAVMDPDTDAVVIHLSSGDGSLEATLKASRGDLMRRSGFVATKMLAMRLYAKAKREARPAHG